MGVEWVHFQDPLTVGLLLNIVPVQPNQVWYNRTLVEENQICSESLQRAVQEAVSSYLSPVLPQIDVEKLKIFARDPEIPGVSAQTATVKKQEAASGCFITICCSQCLIRLGFRRGVVGEQLHNWSNTLIIPCPESARQENQLSVIYDNRNQRKSTPHVARTWVQPMKARLQSLLPPPRHWILRRGILRSRQVHWLRPLNGLALISRLWW